MNLVSTQRMRRLFKKRSPLNNKGLPEPEESVRHRIAIRQAKSPSWSIDPSTPPFGLCQDDGFVVGVLWAGVLGEAISEAKVWKKTPLFRKNAVPKRKSSRKKQHDQKPTAIPDKRVIPSLSRDLCVTCGTRPRGEQFFRHRSFDSALRAALRMTTLFEVCD
ncbi:hypothetical protein [Rhodocaloribacter sp.]